MVRRAPEQASSPPAGEPASISATVRTARPRCSSFEPAGGSPGSSSSSGAAPKVVSGNAAMHQPEIVAARQMGWEKATGGGGGRRRRPRHPRTQDPRVLSPPVCIAQDPASHGDRGQCRRCDPGGVELRAAAQVRLVQYHHVRALYLSQQQRHHTPIGCARVVLEVDGCRQRWSDRVLAAGTLRHGVVTLCSPPHVIF